MLEQAFNGLKVQDINNIEKVAELLERFDLRWNVSKQPLILPNGSETPYLAVVREDNNEVFTTCKDGYTPFQNSELAELLIRISDKTGYEIHSGGMFNGGGKVYIQLSTGNQISSIGENRSSVKGFITGINGHDGTTSLKWGSVNFTVCCKNTFSRASSELKNKARHTISIHDQVSRAIADIEGVLREENNVFSKFRRMAETPASKDDIRKVVKSVTSVDLGDQSKEYSTYAVNRAGELLNSISAEMSTKGDTMWGLFSGVTHYTTHVMPVPKRDNARLESKYVGNGGNIDNQVFAYVS